jgi:hypothetical protein
MKTLFLLFTLACFNVVQAGEVEQAWGLNQPSKGISVAVIAVGLSPKEIYSQVGIIASGGAPLKKIVIQSPDQNADSIAADLQKRFPNVSIEVSYSK